MEKRLLKNRRWFPLYFDQSFNGRGLNRRGFLLHFMRGGLVGTPPDLHKTDGFGSSGFGLMDASLEDQNLYSFARNSASKLAPNL